MLNNYDNMGGQTIYINSERRGAISDFADSMRTLLNLRMSAGRDLVLLCIGTDRITGDSLGPIIGHNLLKNRALGKRAAGRGAFGPSSAGAPDAKCVPPARSVPQSEALWGGSISIYGTLESPVHAKNLSHTLEDIYSCHGRPLVVAVDASLGQPQSVGFVTIGAGTLSPGAGIKNSLPDVGDIYVTGIVNSSGSSNLSTLQNTRLALVVRLADVITKGFVRALK